MNFNGAGIIFGFNDARVLDDSDASLDVAVLAVSGVPR
jgi:hypothetical protein